MSKKIHLVIDAQNDFITGALKNDVANERVPNIVRALGQAAVNEESIYFTMDSHDKNYLDTPEGKKLPVEHCIKYTDGWMIDNRLQSFVKIAKCVVWKPTFGYAHLERYIDELHLSKDHGAETELHVYGFCTDICVVSNVLILKAQYPDLRIIVHSNCCAGVTPESHEAALTVMKACQIEVI